LTTPPRGGDAGEEVDKGQVDTHGFADYGAEVGEATGAGAGNDAWGRGSLVCLDGAVDFGLEEGVDARVGDEVEQ
jgi:hypothetical protein